MDNKYSINRDKNGNITWVKVEKANGEVEIKHIKNVENASDYMKDLHNLNEKYPDFFKRIVSNDYVNQKAKTFEKEQNRILNENYKEEKRKVKKQNPSRFSLRKKVAAGAVAAALFLSAVPGFNLIKTHLKNMNSGSESYAAEDNDNTQSLKGKSVKELLNMLKTTSRQQAFKKIVNTQDYFNNTAAPTVSKPEDQGKQLFVTFGETASTYIYANAKAISSDKMASIFGKSKILCKNAETGEYETLDKDEVAANYLTFCVNLSYYYQRGAVEISGVHQLFENEKEAEMFKEFESLVLEYNKTKDKTVASQIRSMLEEIYLSGHIDSLKNKYPGASSIIATAIVPHLYQNKVIDKNMYNSIIEINENITCQGIYNEIDKIILKLKENKQENIIERIQKLQDKKIRDLDRNISLYETLEGYRLSDLSSTYDNVLSASGFKGNKTVKHIVTTNRAVALSHTSESQVRDAEKAADKKLQDKNKEEDLYWDGFNAGYNMAYDMTWNAKGASVNVSIPSGSSSYVKGYKAGVAKGKAAAKEDYNNSIKAQQNYKPEKKPDSEKETTWVPENNSNPSDSKDSSEPTKPDEQIEPPLPSAPSNQPNQKDIIEEKWVFEETTTNETNRQKVTEIKSLDKIEIQIDGTTYESGIQRVRS